MVKKASPALSSLTLDGIGLPPGNDFPLKCRIGQGFRAWSVRAGGKVPSFLEKPLGEGKDKWRGRS